MRFAQLPPLFSLIRVATSTAEFLVRHKSRAVLSKRIAIIGLSCITSVVSIFTLVSVNTPVLATSGTNQNINIQGKVTNSNGTNVTDGTYDFVFKLYDGPSSTSNTTFTESWTSVALFSSTMSSAPGSGGESLTYSSDTNESTLKTGQFLWNVTKKEAVKIVSVNTTGTGGTITISPTAQAWSNSDTITNKIYVKDGIFQVALNSLNADPAWGTTDFSQDTIFLGINFNADGEMKPRSQFNSVAYAYQAKQVTGLSVASGKTLTVNNSLSLSGADGKAINFGSNDLTFSTSGATSLTLPSSGTLATLAGVENLTNKTVNGLTITSTTGTLTIASGKTLTASNTLTFAGTDGQTFTFPNGSSTVCTIASGCGGGVTANSLDFAQFKDAMTLDAGTDIATAGFTLSTSGTGAVQLNNTGGLSTASDFTVAANKSIKLTGGTSFPGSPSEGQLFFRTDNKQLYVYENSQWQADRSTATEIVSASNSQNKEKADFVGNGTADDVAINAAIAALPSGGGVVYLLDGTYNITASIVIAKSNVKIIGAGKSTILKRMWDETSANTSGVITLGDNASAYSGIAIEGIAIDGNKATYTNANDHGILLRTKISNSQISDSWITNNKGNAIYMYGAAGSGTANTYNTISNNDLSTSNDGVYLNYYNSQTLITGNTFRSNTNMGAELFATNDYTTLSNNFFISNTNNGIYTTQGNNITITGNTVSGSGADGVYIYSDSKVTVAGNSFISNTGNGVTFRSSTDSSVSSNTVSDNSGVGIYLYINSYRTSVTGNSVKGNASDGIIVGGGGDSNIVSSNTLYNNGGSGSSNGITVGDIFGGATNNTLSDNGITDTAGTGYAIYVKSTSTGNVLSDNTYSGTGASSISDNATNTIYSGQLSSTNLILKPTGNIGLGTTSPTAQLHEKGNLATALSGTFGVTNTSASVSTSVDQTSTLNPGDAITFASQAGTAYTISSLNSSTITLTGNYTGSTNAATTASRDVTNLFEVDNGAGTAKLIVDKTGGLTVGSFATTNGGAVTATKYNGLAITNNGTNTLTIAAGKTLTASNTLTFTGTDGSSVAFGTGGTVCYTGTCAANSVRLDQIAAANTTASIDSGTNAITWNWGSLTTQTGLTLGGGSAMTTGSLLSASATYVHTGTEAGSFLSLQYTDASTNTSGQASTYGLFLTPNVNNTGAGTKLDYGIYIRPTTMTCSGGGNCNWAGINVQVPTPTGFNAVTGIQLSTTGSNPLTGNLLSFNNTSATAFATTNFQALDVGTLWGSSSAIESATYKSVLVPSSTSGSAVDGFFADGSSAPATGVTVNSFKAYGPTSGGAGTYNGLVVTGLATTTGGTANGITITATNSQSAGAVNGINIAALTAGTATEDALNIGSGWDAVLHVGSNDIIDGSGVLKSAGLSGTYSNALTLSSGSNVFTGSTYNNLSITAGASSAINIAAGKTLTASNTLTFAGTDGQTFTFPNGSSTVCTVATGCGGAGGLFTQGSGFAYLTSTTDGLVLGGTTTAGAKLWFDTTNSNLKIGTDGTNVGTLTLFSSTSGKTATIANDASGNLNLSAASGAAVVVGAGSGNVNISLTNSGDLLLADKTVTLAGALSSVDYQFKRNITAGANALGGAVLKIWDTSSGSSTLNGDLILGNEALTSGTFTGNLLRLQNAGTDKFVVDGTGLTTITKGSSLTTGTGLALTGSYTHPSLVSGNETGSLQTLTFTDSSTNGSLTYISTTNGLSVAATVSTSGGGSKFINGVNIAAPTLTGCATGNCTVNGLQVSTATSGAASTITQNGFNIIATGIGSGTLNGINISGITAGAGTETGLKIGSGWDSAISANGVAVIGDGTTNYINLDPGSGLTYFGTARKSKVITLSPEFPDSSFSADGSSTTAGSLTTDNTLSSTTNWRNYYQWTSTNAALQDYTIITRITIPKDFDSWETGSCPGSTCALELQYATGTASTADNAVSVQVNNVTNNTAICTLADAASTSWTSNGCTSTNLASGATWNAVDAQAVVRIKVKAKNTASAQALVGDLILRYKAKF